MGVVLHTGMEIVVGPEGDLVVQELASADSRNAERIRELVINSLAETASYRMTAK